GGCGRSARNVGCDLGRGKRKSTCSMHESTPRRLLTAVGLALGVVLPPTTAVIVLFFALGHAATRFMHVQRPLHESLGPLKDCGFGSGAARRTSATDMSGE